MSRRNIRVTDPVWKNYKELVRKEMIPYQWAVLNDSIDIAIERERNDDSIPNEKSHAIENLKIAAGLKKGEHYGWVFQDSDVYKWLEAVAYSLLDTWDDSLKALADEVVELISKAQEADGYINTFFTISGPERRYMRLAESHELYCMGHLLEALVAYNMAAGSSLAMEIAAKLADHLCDTFGPEEGKYHFADGHEEIEIGLMKLYHLKGDNRYRDLAEYFLKVRADSPKEWKRLKAEDKGGDILGGISSEPSKYNQTHLPVEKQDTAEGHAVRVVYMCSAMADVAEASGNKDFAAACRKIWRNIVDKRMYITGGIGSTVLGESFTLDYDLPNDTMYCETCASIGLIFFAKQMLKLDRNGEYADVMERALYNTALSGMALDGKHFFYVNPLEVVPQKGKLDPTKSHVKSVRPEWLGCACCPPNLARLITSVEDYIYSVFDDAIFVNLFIASELEPDENGKKVFIKQKTDYPKSGKVLFEIDNKEEKETTIAIRLPGWTDDAKMSLDGTAYKPTLKDGYMYVPVSSGEHTIDFEIEIKPKRWYANLDVSEDIHKVAVARGPQVYCVEEKDNGSGLHRLLLNKESRLVDHYEEDLLGGVCVVEGDGERCTDSSDSESIGGLYTDRKEYKKETVKIRFIPYNTWGNRGENEMRVWLSEE